MWAQAIQRARDLHASLNPRALPRLAHRALSLDSGSAHGYGLGPTATATATVTALSTTGGKGKAWAKSSSGGGGGGPRRAAGERASSPCLEAAIAEEEEDEDDEEGGAGGGTVGVALGSLLESSSGSVKERAHSDRELDKHGVLSGVLKNGQKKLRPRMKRSKETFDLSASENFADRLRFRANLGNGAGEDDKTPTLPRSSSGSLHEDREGEGEGEGEDDVNVNYEGLLNETASENNATGASVFSSGPNSLPASVPSHDSNKEKEPTSPPFPQSVPSADGTERRGSQGSNSNKADVTFGIGASDRRGSQSSSSASTGGTGGGEREGGEEARAARKVAELKRELGVRRETDTMLREVLRQRDRRLLDSDHQIAELEHSLLETQQEVARLKERLGQSSGQRRDAFG